MVKARNCPHCGVALGLSSRKLARLYEQEFGSIPVMNMIDRGWLLPWLGHEPNKWDIPTIEKALFGFFGVEDEDEFWEELERTASKTLVNGVPMMLCVVEPDRPDDKTLANFDCKPFRVQPQQGNPEAETTKGNETPA